MRANLQKKGAEEVLKFIIEFQKENGYSPSMREIGDGVGIKSSSTVCYVLRYLEREKYIETVPNKSRIIKVLEEEWHGGKKISDKAD